MKRSAPLVRKKAGVEFRSARYLVRRAELDAITPALLERAGYLCEICRVKPVEHRHHKLRRSQGGTNDLDNLLALDNECHEMVHAFPALSYERGWLTRSGIQR